MTATATLPTESAIGWSTAAREADRARHQQWIVSSLRYPIERGPLHGESVAEFAARLSALLVRETAVADGLFPEAGEFYAAIREQVAA